MWWQHKLDQWRAKPESARRTLALWGSALLTFMIVGLWSASWSFKGAGSTNSSVAKRELTGASQTASVWQINKTRLQTGWKILTNQK